MIIGLDVGGTHTDAVLISEQGVVESVKVATDTEDLYGTLMSALSGLTEKSDLNEIRRVVFSTTLATNMVVQEKLPSVAVLVAAGPGIHPENFRVGDHFHVVRGAMDHSGRILEKVDREEIEQIGEGLKREGVEYAAVVTKFSVRNPAQELEIAGLLEPYVKKVFTGHALSGVLNFPRRIATCYLNGCVHGIHAQFFQAVEHSLQEQGMRMPIHILKPDGGNMNVSSSLEYPAQTILSGPSASVMGALASCPTDRTCLVLDIGGTTTDMAVIFQGAPVIAKDGIEIGPHKTLIRALLTRSIGVGGDSVVRIKGTDLTIGPERQGVAACFGGTGVTPTDAFAVLGDIVGADREKANKAIVPLAEEMGKEVEEVATVIIDKACSMILEAANQLIDEINSRPVYTVHEMYEGEKLDPDHILVLGGPAAQFAEVLRKVFTGSVEAVPHWQVANAMGCALSKTTCEVSVFADTGRGVLTSSGMEYDQPVDRSLDLEGVKRIAIDLVTAKALERGANPSILETEVVEESQFNMIRGFNSGGKNIRVRAQVKPGLIASYDKQSGQLRGELG